LWQFEKELHWEVFNCFRQISKPYSSSKYVLEEFNDLANHPKTYWEGPSFSRGGAHCMVSAICHVVSISVNSAGKFVVAVATSVKSTNVW
jgi:hypothetical protein